MTLLKTVSLTAVTLGLLSLSASADWHGRGGHHGGRGYYGGGPRVSIGIGLAPAPIYYGPTYYAPRAYYYEPPVVVAPRPVVVGREVGGGLTVDVQRVLARKGYYNGVVDGDLGPRSRAAIRAWQADCGLRVTGSLNAETLRTLGLL